MAGATPIYGFPYPQASDLVANYPALGQDLAEDVETQIALKRSIADGAVVPNNIVTYTPTIGGTGWALGNGTIAGYRAFFGSMQYIYAEIVWGSTSTYGAGALTITAPNITFPTQEITGFFIDVSLGESWGCRGRISASTAVIQLQAVGATNVSQTVISTRPFTWANGDSIRLSGIAVKA